MNYKYLIARRYLFSKKDSKYVSFITYISILGVALGVATLIVTVSILDGFEKEIKEKVAGLVSHIQITSFLPDGLSDYNTTIKEIKDSIPQVTGASPYVQKEAVIRYKENIEGIILKGIVQNTDLSTARNRIKKGEFNLEKIDTIFSRLLIGEKLAQKLGIDIGTKVIVFGMQGIPSPMNPPKIKQFIVSGIYETGLREYDDVLIYTDLTTTQKLFDYEDRVTGIELKVSNIDDVEKINSKLKQMLDYPHFPKSLFRLYKGLFSWVELQKAPTPIILGLIIIVATFNIIGTLLMLILEKTQSVGILKSLGASNYDIMKIFLFDGIIIGLIGIIIGNALGLGLCLAELKYKFFKLPEIYYMKNVPILLQTDNIILISCITILLVFLATIIPAYLASKFDPVKSLRF
ncbi:MAG: ABC transporter permease [Ignavibacteria bacterium]